MFIWCGSPRACFSFHFFFLFLSVNVVFLAAFWLYEVFHEKLLGMDFFLTPFTFLVVYPLGFVCLDTRAPVGREGLALLNHNSTLEYLLPAQWVLRIHFRYDTTPHQRAEHPMSDAPCPRQVKALSALAFILWLEPLHWLHTRALMRDRSAPVRDKNFWVLRFCFRSVVFQVWLFFLSFSFIEFFIQINKLNKIKTNKQTNRK